MCVGDMRPVYIHAVGHALRALHVGFSLSGCGMAAIHAPGLSAKWQLKKACRRMQVPRTGTPLELKNSERHNPGAVPHCHLLRCLPGCAADTCVVYLVATQLQAPQA